MKTFIYRGYDRDGSRKKGVIEALDIKDAREKLTVAHIFPEHIESATGDRISGAPSSAGRSYLNRTAERAEFYRAMAALLKAGMTLSAAFEVMIDHPSGGHAAMANQLAGIRDRIRDGSRFVQAIAESGVTISAFEEAVLESGEKTGRMASVLEEIAHYLDDVVRLQQSIRSACLYPAVIIVLAIVVGTGVMGFLVPQMAAVFEESGMRLPMITELVIQVGRWFLPVILPIIIGVLFLIIAGYRRMSKQPETKKRVEQVIVRTPYLRRGFELLVTTRFARTSALLLNGGLSLVDAMSLAGRATGSVWLAAIIEEKANAVRHGELFSRALSDVPVISSTLPSWAKAGEASGDLAAMFTHAANRNQEQWTAYIQRTVTIIEPVLIIIVALFVLLVALAILLPILSLNQQLV